jgi:hypothetical protein
VTARLLRDGTALQGVTHPTGIISTAAYDVDVPFMQLERHGWDIHAV